MPVLVPNQAIEQAEPLLRIDNALDPGRHRFALVVVNARGVASELAVWDVRVAAPPIPPPPSPNPGDPPR
jgi:hypothetical protein